MNCIIFHRFLISKGTICSSLKACTTNIESHSNHNFSNSQWSWQLPIIQQKEHVWRAYIEHPYMYIMVSENSSASNQARRAFFHSINVALDPSPAYGRVPSEDSCYYISWKQDFFSNHNILFRVMILFLLMSVICFFFFVIYYIRKFILNKFFIDYDMSTCNWYGNIHIMIEDSYRNTWGMSSCDNS